MGTDGATRGRLLPLPLAQAFPTGLHRSLFTGRREANEVQYVRCQAWGLAPSKDSNWYSLRLFSSHFSGAEGHAKRGKAAQESSWLTPQNCADFATWPATLMSKLKGKSCRRAGWTPGPAVRPRRQL